MNGRGGIQLLGLRLAGSKRFDTSNMIGMLLMTFALTEVVQLLHPSAWVAALAAEEAAHLRDDERQRGALNEAVEVDP